MGLAHTGILHYDGHMTTSSNDLFLRITDAMALRDLEDAQPDVETDPLYGKAWPEIAEAITEYDREEALYWENERRLLREARWEEYYG